MTGVSTECARGLPDQQRPATRHFDLNPANVLHRVGTVAVIVDWNVDLQAMPLLAEIEALAQSTTRISLAAIDAGPPAEPDTLPGLTPANGRSSPTSSPAAPTARSPASWW
jgi:hypothetical protein